MAASEAACKELDFGRITRRYITKSGGLHNIFTRPCPQMQDEDLSRFAKFSDARGLVDFARPMFIQSPKVYAMKLHSKTSSRCLW